MTKTISEKILELRRARGLTQEKLGELCGVSGQAVSKWEKAESLPDIMLVPTLCQALGITADALLEIPAELHRKDCMDSVFAYAEEVGEFRASYEALCATSCRSDRSNGCAKMSAKGVKLHNTKGLGMVISGPEMLRRVTETNIASIKPMVELAADENLMAVVRTLNFDLFLTESEISDRSGLPCDTVEKALFKLLKHGICECHAGGTYTFGAKSYVLFAILAGFYIASPDGSQDIGNLTCSYTTTEM